MANDLNKNSFFLTKDSGIDSRISLQNWVANLSHVPHSENVDAFWNKTTIVFPTGQAALAALFYGSLLDCRGKIGSIKWYIGSRWIPFTKVTNPFAAFLWYLAFLTFLMPILFLSENKESYQVATALSFFGFIGYAFKGFLYSAYRMLVTAVPGNMDQSGFLLKFGLYHMGWMTCVVMFIFALRGLSGGELESVGYAAMIIDVWQSITRSIPNFYFILTDFSAGWWELTKRWFKYVWAFVFMSYIVGTTISPSDRPSIALLNQYNLWNRYKSKGAQWMDQAGAGVIYAIGLCVYSSLHVMHPFFN